MGSERLRIHTPLRLRDGGLIVAFSGWMDGGEVSTGTVDWLVRKLGASVVGSIAPEGFYIYNFPGSMEISALFRPHTRIDDGVVSVYEPPENTFYCAPQHELALFRGKEPNLNWEAFADCMFGFAAQAGVRTLCFVGSYAGAVPHTRQPRVQTTVSDPRLKPALEQLGVSFTEYAGPASFATHLLVQARHRGFRMASLVAEIPAYIQGTNPKCIEAVLRKLVALLGLRVDLNELRELSTAWEERVNSVLEGKPDLASHIRKLEEDYDNEVFDTQMGDLKEWLEQQGIRLD